MYYWEPEQLHEDCMSSVLDASGEETTEAEDVAEVFASFFEMLCFFKKS